MAGLCSTSQGSWNMCRFSSCCTQEIDSRPPATITGTRSTITRCAAIAMACRPEEQKRLTVVPPVVTGRPARSAIWRAMLPPVVPSGSAQPMRTSSTSAGSMRARSTAARTAWAPRVAPWVMLSAPRQDLARPVRAVETMTASVMGVSRAVERPALFGETGQERRRSPAQPLHRAHDVVEADRVRVEHGPAAEGREAVAREVDEVHVGGALRDAFLEDLRALVHQGEDAAGDDLVAGNGARPDPPLAPVGHDHLVHRGIGDGIAAPRLVAVPARARLLPETPL